jgi:hypothetical protein
VNCEDIELILDNDDMAVLDGKVRQAVGHHLANCPGCARIWNPLADFAKLSTRPVPPGFADQCAALVVAKSQRDAQRVRSRLVLITSIVAMAAAAAWLEGQRVTPATNSTVVAQVTAQSPVPSIAEVPSVRSVQPWPEKVAVPRAPPPSGSFTVRVLPVTSRGDDAVGNALVQGFRERLMVKLRHVPGLVLLSPHPRDETDAADYDIGFIFKSNPAAGFYGVEVDAGRPAAVAAMARLAEGSAQDQTEYYRRRMQGLSGRMPASVLVALPASMDFPASVTLSEIPAALRPPGAQDRIDLTLDSLVLGMRVRIFPLNPAFQRELLASLSDSARAPHQRATALGDLLTAAEAHGGFASVDAESVRAGAELALTTADLRAKEMAWEWLRRTKHPELVELLGRGLEEERETKIRLLMVQILAAEYRDNAQALAVLKQVSEREMEQVVRMAALREVQGESEWNEFAAATFRNTSLPDLERLQPIADMVVAVKKTRQVNLQLSDAEVRELADVIMRAAHEGSASGAGVDAVRNSLIVLANMRYPVVRDVLIEIIRLPDKERGLAGASILRTTALAAAAARYPGDEKVRAAIEELAGGSDPLLASAVRTRLQLMDSNAQR